MLRAYLSIFIGALLFTLPALACKTGNCEYYACKAQNLSCPQDSLLTETARPYCVAYDRDKDLYSVEGQQTLAKIKICLQEQMERTPVSTCADSERSFIEAHVACYPPSGYCDLGIGDRILIGKVAFGALFDARFRDAALTIEQICSER